MSPMQHTVLRLLSFLVPLTSVALRAQEGMPAPRTLEIRSEASTMTDKIGAVVDPVLHHRRADWSRRVFIAGACQWRDGDQQDEPPTELDCGERRDFL